MEKWLAKKALILRVTVFLVFAVWIAGPACSYIFKNMPSPFLKEGEWDGRLESLDRENVEKLKADIAEMNHQADLKGTAYGEKSWLNDFARIHELATEYGIPHSALNGTIHLQQLGIQELLNKHVNNYAGVLRGPRKAPESERECDEARARLAIARGEPIPQEKTGAELWAEIWPSLPKAGWFLLKLYLQIMMFCLFWFLLRLAQRDHWGWFSKTTLRDELVLAPGRFVRAVLLWPAWFNVYGRFTDPAKALRYARLKVEYLRQKTGLEQLTPAEEEYLREQAEKPLQEFDKAIAALKEQRALVKRSLAAAMFWFLIGFFFAPFVSPRSKVYQTASICSGTVFALVIEKVTEHGGAKPKLPTPDSPLPLWDAVCGWVELPQLLGEFLGMLPQKFIRPVIKIVFPIDHVPRRNNISFLQKQMGAC